MLLFPPYGVSPLLTAQLHGECPWAWHFDTGATLTNSWSFHLLLHCLLPALPVLVDCIKRMGGRSDRSAVSQGSGGAAHRGLCGWQTPMKQEGGVGHWQNTWASISVHLCWWLQLSHTSACSNAPPPDNSQLRGPVSLVLARQWCSHTTARHCSTRGVVTRRLCKPKWIFFICIIFYEMCNRNVDRLTLPSLRKGMSSTQRQITILLPNHCSTPVMTSRNEMVLMWHV